MYSIQDIANYFCYRTLTQPANYQYRYNDTYKKIENYLNEGWFIEEIYQVIIDFENNNPNRMGYIYSLDAIMPKGVHKKDLIDDIYCYHKDLREPIPPVKISFNDKGEMIREGSDFLVKMKKRYTLDDVLRYYYTLTKASPSENTVKRDEGKMVFLLKEFDVDEILFAIDITYQDKRKFGKKFTDLFHVQDNMERAKNGIKRKRNQERLLKLEER